VTCGLGTGFKTAKPLLLHGNAGRNGHLLPTAKKDLILENAQKFFERWLQIMATVIGGQTPP
jgi:hypothetical protein